MEVNVLETKTKERTPILGLVIESVFRILRALKAPSAMIITICVFGFFVCIIGFFPGWMSTDSISQYQQAIDNVYTDWHPPMFAVWWHFLLQFGRGPVLMLVMHQLMYWGAWALIGLATVSSYPRRSIVLVFLAFSPGVILTFAHIWKDVANAASVFLAVAIIYFCSKTKQSITWPIGLSIFVMLIYAVGVKTNAITAVPLVIAYWIFVEKNAKRLSLIRKTLLTFLSSTIIIGTALGLNASVNAKATNGVVQYTQTYDLLGISVRTGRNYFPAYLKQVSNDYKLTDYYFPGGNNKFFFTVPGVETQNKQNLEALNSSWQSAILSEPLAYIQHRSANMIAQAWPGRLSPGWVTNGGIDSNPYGLQANEGPLTSMLKDLPNTVPLAFHPWVYFSISLFASIKLVARRSIDGLAMTLISLSFYLPHFFVLPASDFRYFVLNYILALVLLAISIIETDAERYRMKSSPENNIGKWKD